MRNVCVVLLSRSAMLSVLPSRKLSVWLKFKLKLKLRLNTHFYKHRKLPRKLLLLLLLRLFLLLQYLVFQFRLNKPQLL